MEDEGLSTAASSSFHLAPTRKPHLASGEPLSSKCREWDSSPQLALDTSIPPKQFKANRITEQKMTGSEKAGEWHPREFRAPGRLTPKRKRPSGRRGWGDTHTHKKKSIRFNFSSVRCVVAPIKRFQGTPRPSLGFWLLFPYARRRSRREGNSCSSLSWGEVSSWMPALCPAA